MDIKLNIEIVKSKMLFESFLLKEENINKNELQKKVKDIFEANKDKFKTLINQAKEAASPDALTQLAFKLSKFKVFLAAKIFSLTKHENGKYVVKMPTLVLFCFNLIDNLFNNLFIFLFNYKFIKNLIDIAESKSYGESIIQLKKLIETTPSKFKLYANYIIINFNIATSAVALNILSVNQYKRTVILYFIGEILKIARDINPYDNITQDSTHLILKTLNSSINSIQNMTMFLNPNKYGYTFVTNVIINPLVKVLIIPSEI